MSDAMSMLCSVLIDRKFYPIQEPEQLKHYVLGDSDQDQC